MAWKKLRRAAVVAIGAGFAGVASANPQHGAPPSETSYETPSGMKVTVRHLSFTESVWAFFERTWLAPTAQDRLDAYGKWVDALGLTTVTCDFPYDHAIGLVVPPNDLHDLPWVVSEGRIGFGATHPRGVAAHYVYDLAAPGVPPKVATHLRWWTDADGVHCVNELLPIGSATLHVVDEAGAPVNVAFLNVGARQGPRGTYSVDVHGPESVLVDVVNPSPWVSAGGSWMAAGEVATLHVRASGLTIEQVNEELVRRREEDRVSDLSLIRSLLADPELKPGVRRTLEAIERAPGRHTIHGL